MRVPTPLTHSILSFVATNFPFLGPAWRYLRAFFESKAKHLHSYSQNGEDVFIWEILKTHDLKGTIYIDVGANHPTALSNTFLLYRKGLSGVICEPNRDYQDLFRRFRPRDIFLPFGCGGTSDIMVLNRGTVPTHNSLDFPNKAIANTYIHNQGRSLDFIPVFPLDHLLSILPLRFDKISLINIDAEGMDYDVLRGADSVLEKAMIVCIEANNAPTRRLISVHLQSKGFLFLRKMDCNLIFRNDDKEV